MTQLKPGMANRRYFPRRSTSPLLVGLTILIPEKKNKIANGIAMKYKLIFQSFAWRPIELDEIRAPFGPDMY